MFPAAYVNSPMNECAYIVTDTDTTKDVNADPQREHVNKYIKQIKSNQSVS